MRNQSKARYLEEAKIIDRISGGKYAEAWHDKRRIEAEMSRVDDDIASIGRASIFHRLLSLRKMAEALRLQSQYRNELVTATSRIQSIASKVKATPQFKKETEPRAVNQKTNPPQINIAETNAISREPNEVIAAKANDVPSISTAQPFSVTIRPSGSIVDYLFASKPRGDWPLPPPGERSSPNIYLPVGDQLVNEALQNGASLGPRGGVFVPPGTPLGPLEAFLPFYAKRAIEPLNVDSIPRTNWGGSLANLVTPSSWDSIRKPFILASGDKCKICGYPSPGGQSADCHEIWEYHRPKVGYIGVQRLVEILAVCKPCHEMFHLGKAGADDRLGEVLGRLAWANRWSPSEVGEYYEYQADKWRQRNKFCWMLDVSCLQLSAPLVLKGGKNGITIDADGDLHFKSYGGEGSTTFLGVDFHHKGGPAQRRQVPSYKDYIKDV